MRERRAALLKNEALARAMRRGFAEIRWQKATTPSNSVSNNTANGLPGHVGRPFKTTECDAVA
jgi:hypothetical protein